MYNFHHRGSLGDIIYSLPLILSMGGGNLYLRKRPHYDFLYSLLNKQDYISNIFCEEIISSLPDNVINLDEFRKIHKKDLHKHLAICHLEILQQEFDMSKSWLFNIDSIFKAPIVINRTFRYHDREEIRWEVLKKYEKDCLFLGIKKEYKLFLEKYKLNIPYFACKDALEMASIIKGSELAIGNQSVFFSMAEAIKHPRVLEVFYGKNNCQPQSKNGYTYLDKKLITSYLGKKKILPESEIKKSPILETIFNESLIPTIFLPNYGEFGSTIHKLIRMVHFHKSPKKIVCCKKGEEALFPSADEFYYDWNNCVEDIHKWGFFSKKRLQGEKNHRYREYQKIISDDFKKIKSIFGQDYNYVHLWKYNKDKHFQNHAHNFRVKLKPITIQDIKADIIISPRNREGRSENNFLRWDELIDVFNKNGYSVGCVGSKEQSLKLNGSHVNSWDYEDNSSAVIELLDNCKLYLGLDTGVSHLASMISVPMIVFSHSNQKHYLTGFMKQATANYFLDLGKNVQDTDVIISNVMKFLEEK